MAPIIQSFEEFMEVHAILLVASGVPPSLHEHLFRKLSTETFDGGDFFSVEPCEGGTRRRLLLYSPLLEKESDIFLVDHAWTFRLPDALKQLREVPGLVERMAAMMCIDMDLESSSGPTTDSKEQMVNGNGGRVSEVVATELEKVKDRGDDGAAWLELEELGIDDDMLYSLDLPSKFSNIIALNLWGNKIHTLDAILQTISKCRNLRAIWLNENPVLYNNADLTPAILDHAPSIEILNSNFTSNFGIWALGFIGGKFSAENPVCPPDDSDSLKGISILDLSNRCILKLPKEFSPAVLPSLTYLNLRGNLLDQCSVDDLFELLREFSLQDLEVDIPGPLGNSALNILEHLPSLARLNGVSSDSIKESKKHIIDSMLPPRLRAWESSKSLPERVIGAMWLYLMTYRLADEEKIDETSVWYMMDELGSAIRHSDEANFRISPFLYMPQGKLSTSISFSVLWPIQNVMSGEECTRDFLFGIGEDKQRSARLTAWFHTPENYFIQEFKEYSRQIRSKCLCPYHPKLAMTKDLRSSGALTFRVYTDIPQIEEFLTRPEFVLTTNVKDADIIWTSMQVDDEVRNAVGLTDRQFVNQFPFEACLVMKHHLADTILKAQGFVDWLQPTYNLETHLSQFIGDYFTRKREGHDNLWILKPWNLARTIDTTVTHNISAIIRLMETGPKICQKYIEWPALFRGKKFDLRYIVLVRSMNPLEIFLADTFWVRLANNTYTLEESSFFEYETHFTVMNYIGRLTHMYTQDFVSEFEKEHQVKWLDIHERIRTMIRAVFESAATVHPEMQNPMSRAIYGVDVMLDSLYNPKLLEVTYCPDCLRACTYDTKSIFGDQDVIRGNDFFNYVFGSLFLGESKHVTEL